MYSGIPTGMTALVALSKHMARCTFPHVHRQLPNSFFSSGEKTYITGSRGQKSLTLSGTIKPSSYIPTLQSPLILGFPTFLCPEP